MTIPIIKILEKSPVVNIGYITNLRIKNKYGKFWLRQKQLLTGITDLRARAGTYTNPWNATSNPLYKIPKFDFVDDSLSDLLDKRALEIYDNAKKTNRKIAVQWSGGIDSTLVLVSFLKNIPEQDRSLINVIHNVNSVLENLNFYKKYISNNLKSINYTTLNFTKDFIKKYILIHGDPGDCIFGPSISKYQYFISQKKHFEPWKNHLKKMKELLELPEVHPETYEPGFGEWYVNKITENLEETKQSEYLTSIAEWWFWTYYNFKWEFSCQRPFVFFKRGNTQDSFDLETQKDLAMNTFFNTDKFQQWAYSNIKKNIFNETSQHKKIAKEYIYEFTKDESFLKNKIKITATPSVFDIVKNHSSPYFYREDYTPIEVGGAAYETTRILLEKYRG